MKASGIILSFFLVLSCIYMVSADKEKESSVLVLTKDNFQKTIEKHNVVLVEFYAPWCGHCKKLEPEYEIVANAFAGNETVAIAKVDCTVEQELATSHGIRGYPTIKLFKDGKLDSDYSGARESESMITWVKEKSLPRIVAVESQEDFDAFLERKSVGKVFAFSSKDDEQIMFNFGKLSDDPSIDDLLFGFTLDKELASSLGRESSSIEVFVDGKWKKYEGEIDYEKIHEFVFYDAYPNFEPLDLTQEFVMRVQKRKVPLVTVFAGENEKMSKEEQVNLAKEIYETIKSAVQFTYTDKSDHTNLAGAWGGSGKVFPTITILNFKDDGLGMFAFDETKELTLESAVQWIDGCISGGDCPSHLKTDPVPENNDGPVKTIVGKTYEEIVHDSNKDVLVKYYTPTCPHCQRMAEAYVELGKKYESDESLIIGEIDASSNSFLKDAERIRGFPTILLFKADDKNNPIAFESGERTVENMSKFLDDNRKEEEVKEEVKKDEESEEEIKKDEL